MHQDELSNCKGVFFISFGLSQKQLGKIRDENRINNNSINSFRTEERKEIDMITTSRFHCSKNFRRVFANRIYGLKEFRKTIKIHIGSDRKTYVAFRLKASNRKGILGDINTNKQIIHNYTSSVLDFGKAGKASQPILHVDKDSKDPINLSWLWEAGNTLLKGLNNPGKMEFSCLSFCACNG
jgi:hypothetical protein